MARDPTVFRNQKDEYLSKAVQAGEVSEADADRIRELVDAFDENRPTVQRPSWPDAPANLRGARSESTLGNWMYFLTRWAKSTELSDSTPREINQVAEDMLHGDLPDVKDDGLSKGTIRAHQNAVRIFYRYYDELDVAHTDVSTFEQNTKSSADKSWGPEDILDRDEIDRVQAETSDYRDAAVFNLLLYTGARNRALRTLRIKDVNPEEGTYRFNPEEGTKDIYKPRAPRPLFGAKGPVREWLNRHPTPDDPEAYLITGNPKYTNVDAHEAVSDRTIGRITNRLKETADISKPMHPHMLRHNFVYICKRVYEIPDDTIRFYLGHAPDSTIMEQTYSHLSAEDHLERGRAAAGEIDPDDSDRGFELETCNNCGNNLPANAKACPVCGTVFTPDAKDAVGERVEADKAEAETVEAYEEADEIAEAIAEDDILAAQVRDRLDDMAGEQ